MFESLRRWFFPTPAEKKRRQHAKKKKAMADFMNKNDIQLRHYLKTSDGEVKEVPGPV
jgi:hypothetical protein